MKSVKIQQKMLICAILLSGFSYASDNGEENAYQLSGEHIEITQKVNKIIKHIRTAENELEPLNCEDLIFANYDIVDTKKLAELLDWFKEYVKLEKEIIARDGDNKFRYAAFGYSVLAALDTMSSLASFSLPMSAAAYGMPAAYSAYKVLAPDVTNKLQALKAKHFRKDLKFSNMISAESDESKNFQDIVKMAEDFYRGVKSQNVGCAYSNESIHCQAQNILNKPWYLRLFPISYQTLANVPYVSAYLPQPSKKKKK